MLSTQIYRFSIEHELNTLMPKTHCNFKDQHTTGKDMFLYDNKSKAEVTVLIYHLIINVIGVMFYSIFKFLELTNSGPRSYHLPPDYAFERGYGPRSGNIGVLP